MTDAKIERALKVWDRTIEVQEHFNDIEMRIRNYALTLLAALIGAAGLAVQNNSRAVAVMLLIAGLLAWIAFYLMDRFWYHPLLRGAVDHARELEKVLAPDVPGIGLATAIGAASPTVIRKADATRNRKAWEVHSPMKMDIFYGIFGFALVVVLVLVASGVGTR